MPCTSAVLPASPTIACTDAAVPPRLDGDGTHAPAGQPAQRKRRHARRPGPARGTMKGLAIAMLLASATGAGAQVPRNGPEWGGKDHQPTEAEVLRRERRAGVQTPKARRDQDKRTVDQLDQQLLREEGLDAPRSPAHLAPR